MNRSSIITVILLIASFPLFSQVDHYWTQQFGASSTLTGGAMVAGVRDNSATFYNPGGLAFVEFPNLSIDANLYKLDKLKITDGAGSGVNLNMAQMTIYPQILAGMISYIKIPRLRFSWCILTRNYGNIVINKRYTKDDGTTNIFMGELDYVNQLNEQWFGLCASYKANEHLGIGMTLFGTYRGETSSIRNDSREVSGPDSSSVLVVTTRTDNMKYNVFRALLKFGVAYELKRWRFGISVTTPSLGFYGKANVRREESYSTSSAMTPDEKKTVYILGEDQSAKATYYHPLSIAAGIEYKSPKTRIAISAEYFFRIASYDMVAPATGLFVYPASAKDSAAIKNEMNNFLKYGNAAKPVFNVGIGLDQSVGKLFSILLGAHTDYSSYVPTDDSKMMNHGTGSWDLYYVSTGLSYHRQRQILTLGFTYAFSPVKSIQPIAIVVPGETQQVKSSAFAQSFGVVLGYTYFFPR
jgi:hypothetical protein